MASTAIRNLPSIPSGQSGLYHHETASVPVITLAGNWFDAIGRRWEGESWSTTLYDVHPPVVTSAVVFSLAENTPLTIPLTADKAVTWTKTGGADAGAFALAGATVTFGAKDFEAPSDAGTNNVYDATFAATDAAGNVTPFALAVTVTNVLEGALAAITPTAGTVDSSAAATAIVLDLPALVEGESRRYDAISGPSFNAFSMAGDLLRGAGTWSAAGTALGDVVQIRAGVETKTRVTITLTSVATPPTGFIYLTDPDGSRLTDPDGAYLMEAA